MLKNLTQQQLIFSYMLKKKIIIYEKEHTTKFYTPNCAVAINKTTNNINRNNLVSLPKNVQSIKNNEY